MVGFLSKLLGDSNERALKKLRPLVERINALEPHFEKLSDAELRAKTDEFRRRLGQEHQTLDDLLPEAFALVREAAKRTLGQRHFDVQLIGGIVLHQGKVAEMKTGEGKTLTATLPIYLNALEGKGVHLVTVNDYLAKRDTQWMGPIYHLLGLKVGCLQHEASYVYDPSVGGENPSLKHLRPVPRREAYLAHVTYGTNSEFGFDYLRDNMALDLSQCVQRELHYAIVDEVDNILIDEARTPLIISGPAQESTQLYYTFARLVPRLKEGEDYTVEEKHRTVSLTEEGISKLERWLNIDNLYAPENIILTHYVENALKALLFYRKDREYVVKDGEVIIVDEFTGRLMFGRRYADGLHQAIEAKEGVKVQRENVTYATITLQNYFRLYHKLAGMTGTAATEAEEFWKIYGMEVVVIPTHKPMIRKDLPDLVFKTQEAKFRAVVRDIEELYRKGRPVLVGTTSIENSEKLSQMLQRRGIPHQVLNAKHHEREAQIVAQAGRPGMVTVATNMAGRGTDIILGGNPQGLLEEELRKRGGENLSPQALEEIKAQVQARWEEEHKKVVALGGLHIIGTERHEARRIDNQLRGRAGRQGDPGSSRFYVSLEDDLLRRFGGDSIKRFMDWVGMEDAPIENRMITRAIENAQVKVEAYHFDIRKHLVEFDDVLNKQREVIYRQRRQILERDNLKPLILTMLREEVQELLSTYLGAKDPSMWDLEALLREVSGILPLDGLSRDRWHGLERKQIEEQLLAHLEAFYNQLEERVGEENMRALERLGLLRTMDLHWVRHLTAMENLRQGIGLHAYGQRDPLMMYKKEGAEAFRELQSRIRHDAVRTVCRTAMAHSSAPSYVSTASSRRPEPVVAGGHKVGRNDPCPCGSGKKYKKCHGA